MNTRLALCTLALVLIGLTVHTQADVLLTGDYDSATTNANQVDASATADGSNQLSLGSFEALVEAAFLTQTGGVVTFDQSGDEIDDNAVKNMAFSDGTVLATVARNGFVTVQTGSTNRTPISGANGYGGAQTYSLLFDEADQITAVGLTVLSRDATGGTATITAFFVDADGLNQEAVAASSEMAQSNGGDDTFFGFSAPAGKFLSEVSVSTPYFTWIDDLGVVAVPEPGALGLISLVAVFGLARRRTN